MPNIWGKLPHVVFQHLLVIWVFTGQWWRPKIWLRCLFTASLCYFLQTCFYPFIPSPFQNCLNSHFHFLPTLPFFHVSLIAVLFEKGSCLCLHSVCISVSHTSMSPIPKSNFIVWEKNVIMALRILVLHEIKKKHLQFFIHIFSMFLSL